MAKTNPERFRLQVVGADEDVPRMLLAYGRGCGGEVAFVMRPRDGVAFHVHQVAKEPARVWRTDAGLQLDAGAFLLGLERAADTEAVVLGKPSGAFFAAALSP